MLADRARRQGSMLQKVIADDTQSAGDAGDDLRQAARSPERRPQLFNAAGVWRAIDEVRRSSRPLRRRDRGSTLSSSSAEDPCAAHPSTTDTCQTTRNYQTRVHRHPPESLRATVNHSTLTGDMPSRPSSPCSSSIQDLAVRAVTPSLADVAVRRHWLMVNRLFLTVGSCSPRKPPSGVSPRHIRRQARAPDHEAREVGSQRIEART